MRHFLFFSVSFFFFCSSLFSQITYPLNYRDAISKGSRTEKGVAGENYWINKAGYSITADFNPSTRILSGKADITYFNNSPDSLHEIVLKVYHDFYREGNARDFEINPDAINEGVKIKTIGLDGKLFSPEEYDSLVSRSGTIRTVKLKEALLPESRINIFIEWEYEVSVLAPVRNGAYSDFDFFIGYWYPQIAVYDDIDGWDKLKYTGITETYNDFNDYQVEISVPDDFIIWATGSLQNPEELLQEKYLRRYKNSLTSDDLVKIISEEDTGKEITYKNGKNIWKFSAQAVPDFAFALSNRYYWDQKSVVVDDKGRRVVVSAAYNPESEDFYLVADIAAKSVKYFSDEMPGIPFPWPEVTVFNGRGGMEYPMMVNDGSSSRMSGTVYVTSHEIAHTYFPFYTGTNERKFAWMDEGWAVFLPYGIQAELAEGFDPMKRNAGIYNTWAATEFDVPPMVLSWFLRSRAYRNPSYNRSASAYQVLENILGRGKFLECLRGYIHEWKGKHPQPYDFFNYFSSLSGKELSWFWKPWFFEFKYPDLSLKLIEINGKKTVEVLNEGGLPLPVILKIFYDDKNEVIKKDASVWNNRKKLAFELEKGAVIQKIILDNPHFPDYNGQNNSIYFDNSEKKN